MVGEVRAPTKVPYVSAVAHHRMVDKTDSLRILFFEREDKRDLAKKHIRDKVVLSLDEVRGKVAIFEEVYLLVQ